MRLRLHAQYRPGRADDGVANDGAGDGRAGDGVRTARQRRLRSARKLPWRYVEALEIRDIGGERLARNADHQDRLLMGDDHGSGNDALGRYRGDDVERAAGIADRARDLTGGECIAEDAAIGGTHDRGRRGRHLLELLNPGPASGEKNCLRRLSVGRQRAARKRHPRCDKRQHPARF